MKYKIDYEIREMRNFEYDLLNDFLYEAIFQKDEDNLAPREIINKPELKIYIEDFGLRKDDYCFCAVIEEKIVGAVWVRKLNGYVSRDMNKDRNSKNERLEIAISLYKQYRGYGIGKSLMKSMLGWLKKKDVKRVFLSVQKENFALKMYKNLGFGTIYENYNECIMEYVF